MSGMCLLHKLGTGGSRNDCLMFGIRLLEKRIEKIEKRIVISNSKQELHCGNCGWRGDKSDLIDSVNHPFEFVFCPVCKLEGQISEFTLEGQISGFTITPGTAYNSVDVSAGKAYLKGVADQAIKDKEPEIKTCFICENFYVDMGFICENFRPEQTSDGRDWSWDLGYKKIGFWRKETTFLNHKKLAENCESFKLQKIFMNEDT